MIKKISKKDFNIKKLSKTYTITEMITGKLSKKLSCCISTAKNHKETTMNRKSDRFYYVLSGKINVKYSKKRLTVKKGEVIFIPKNTKYSFSGTFKAIQVLSPPFNLKNDKTWY